MHFALSLNSRRQIDRMTGRKLTAFGALALLPDCRIVNQQFVRPFAIMLNITCTISKHANKPSPSKNKYHRALTAGHRLISVSTLALSINSALCA